MARRSKGCFLGIDLGTSSVKAVACDGEGTILATGRRDLELIARAPLQAEQDGLLWWAATKAAVCDVTNALPDPRAVDAIGLTGQKHALLPLDEGNQPVRPAFLWADGRARNEVEEMKLVFPAMRRRTGFDSLPGLLVPKWLRFVRTEPEAARETKRVCYAKDFVRLQLTGVFATDRSEASASQLFDFRRNTWSETLTTIFDMPLSALPDVKRCIEPTGTVHDQAALDTGVPMGTPVVAGAGDNESAAVAAGALDEGCVAVILGTSGTVIGWSKLRTPAGGLVWNRHATTAGYAATGTVLSAGRAIDWARHAFFPPGTRMVQVLREAEAVDPSTAPLVFLPSLVGERSPVPDPHATGAFVGLRPQAPAGSSRAGRAGRRCSGDRRGAHPDARRRGSGEGAPPDVGRCGVAAVAAPDRRGGRPARTPGCAPPGSGTGGGGAGGCHDGCAWHAARDLSTLGGPGWRWRQATLRSVRGLAGWQRPRARYATRCEV